jgi:hypothetical protein
MLTITYHTAFGSAAYAVLQAQNAATQALGLYVTGNSTTGFVVNSLATPASSQPNTTFGFTFFVYG